MASVHLRFVAPDIENLMHLKIYESTNSSGPFAMIEDVVAIGTYPGYIDEYTTSLAVSSTNWFAIEWVDNKGATTNLSPSIKGGTDTVPGEVVDRVMMRDASLREGVVLQEAEAVVATVYGSNPYDPTITPTYQEWRGLTNMTLAYCYITSSATSSSTSGAAWVAGIVSMKGDTSATTSKSDAIKALLASAALDLGLAMSTILQLAELRISGGIVSSLDQTRLLVEVR